MSDARDDVTLGHDFDGIQEFDNRLPNWWLFTLYGSVVFSVGYWLFYQTFAVGHSQDQSYELEVQVAAAAQLEREMGKEVTNESLLLMTQVPAQLDAGMKTFQQKCTQCHKIDGTGDIGPNLTDEYWLHGPDPLQIYNTVMNGVLDKGMQAWKDQLGPVRVRQVVSYVVSRKGMNLPGKAPQGKHITEWAKEAAAKAPPKAGEADGKSKDGTAPASAPTDPAATPKAGG